MILLATSVPAGIVHGTTPSWLDDVVHAVLYAVLGWLVGTALWASGRRGPAAFAVALVAIAAFAGLDEVHQRWMPGRVPAMSDWLADVVGATIGLLAGMLAMRQATTDGAAGEVSSTSDT